MRLLLLVACSALAAEVRGVAIGAGTPDVALTAADGASRTLRALQQKPVTVLVFLSAQCPVSNKYVGRLNELARRFEDRVTVLGVNSNRNETLDEMRQHAADYRLVFDVYKDPANAVDAFGASVTPEAVVLDRDHRIRYRGRIDDAQNPARVNRQDLRLAIEALLAGRPVTVSQAKALGCSIHRPPPAPPSRDRQGADATLP